MRFRVLQNTAVFCSAVFTRVGTSALDLKDAVKGQKDSLFKLFVSHVACIIHTLALGVRLGGVVLPLWLT